MDGIRSLGGHSSDDYLSDYSAFHGVITQRAESEEHEPLLREWTQQLMHRTGTKATSTSDVRLSSYSAWLFTESINRTIIVSLLVEAMFSIQKR